jgi:hypothetical protein
VKFKKAMVSIGLAATLAVSGQVVTADNNRAQALTKSQCYIRYDSTNGAYGSRIESCWYDYNWWEEVFLGKHDGRYYAYVPAYA